MARNKVDLPEPEGPSTSVDSCGISARSPTWASLRPSGSVRSRLGIDIAEHAPRAVDLPVLTLQKRDLLAVFAHAREVEAEVGLHRLLAEDHRRHLAPYQMHRAGAEEGPADRAPEKKAGDRDAEQRQI